MALSVVEQMIGYLKQVESHGKEKYGEVDWERFRKDGRDDNLASIIRHIAAQTHTGQQDAESGIHHGAHAAFRLLMQVIEDERSTE